MKNRFCGIIAGLNTEAIKVFIERFALRAFAEEQDQNDSGGENNEPDAGGDKGGEQKQFINFEDLISKVRKEEKDKQYNNISRLKGQIDTLTEQHNNDLLKVGTLEKQVEDLKAKLTTAGKGDSEEIKELKSTIKTLESEKTALTKKVEDYEKNKPQSREEIAEEVRKELEKEYEVRTYKAEKLAENKDLLLVPELVIGESKEDIDKSLEAALARSAEIRKSLGLSEPDGKEPPKKNTQGRTPKSPKSKQQSGREVDLDYLAGLDVRGEEYAKLRQQLGLR